MAVKAPTFIQEAESSWNPGGNVESQEKSFPVKVGDWIVVYVMNEEGGETLSYSVAGGGLTWTQLKVVSKKVFGYVGAWAAKATKEETITVKVTASGQNQYKHIGVWGFDALTFRGSEGIGAVEVFTGEGAPKGTLTTLSDESVVVVANNDWNALSGTRTWRTVNGITPTAANGLETSFFNASGVYTIYGAYYTSAGKAGAKEVGLSAPTGEKFSMIAIEVKGTAEGEGKALTVEVADAGKGADSLAGAATSTLADKGTGKDQQGSAASSSLSDKGQGADTVASSASAALADKGQGADALTGALGLGLSDAGRGSDSLAGQMTVGLTDGGLGLDGLAGFMAAALADQGVGVDEAEPILGEPVVPPIHLPTRAAAEPQEFIAAVEASDATGTIQPHEVVAAIEAAEARAEIQSRDCAVSIDHPTTLAAAIDAPVLYAAEVM